MHLLSALALRLKLLLWLCCFLSAGTVFAQSAIIPLYTGAPPGSENWNWTEAENEQNAWQTKVVYNVSRPSLTVFTPEPVKSNGTAVIICPGGAFRALSINNEGFDVANWLVKKGVTCFVLKYRLVRSLTADPVAEMGLDWGSPAFEEASRKLIPLAIADGRNAIAYVRRHAEQWNIDPNRIGIMGFSAGGTVAGATAYGYDQTNRPDFVAPVYAYFPKELQGKLLQDAPPAFFAAATDDGLDLAPHTVGLYQQWMESKKSAELHLYAKGGHGFGMRFNHTPSDKWIDRFGDWLQSQGWLSKSAYDPALNAYERKVFDFGEGKQLPYRILYPENYDPRKKYPLLLFLHGAGERGEDNDRQLIHGAKLFLQPEYRKQFPAIIVWPQCPANSYWSSVQIDRSKQPMAFDFDYSRPANWPLEAANVLVRKLTAEGAVDKGRIYITGLSMGGMGTFEAVYRYPELYAAAVPICGGGNATQYDARVKSTAFRIFHGDQDAVVSVQLSREMAERLKALKIKVLYREYPGVNHNSWDPAFAEPDFLKWIFEQKRKAGL